jgi:dipeptidase D
MSEEIKNLNPQLLWKHFYALTQIPRPSKHEQKAAQYCFDFGKSLGLETKKDEVGNILIKKPATAGMENRKTLILQGHVDMVPQKNNDTQHDFLKDPIRAYIDGEWIKAKGTTLGADNGIGVAAALAVLEDNSLVHGPIEVLVTIDEETGMAGAFGIKPGFLEGDILLNLDSEDEGELYIGCAGGIDTNAVFEFTKEAVPSDVAAYNIKVGGLKGGHSGLDIVLCRGNSNKLLNRILWNSFREHGLRLSSIEGGSLRNAIPRESSATITIPKQQQSQFEASFKELSAAVVNEFKSTDPDIAIECTPTETPSFVIDNKTTKGLFNAIYACIDGIIRMSPDMPGVVETSTNFAIVKTEENTIGVGSLQRSSIDTAKYAVAYSIRSAFESNGAKVEHGGEYPGWKPDVNSAILKAMKESYHAKYGKTPEVKVIHAGLECGIIGAGSGKQLDMISFGPTIRFPHSPDEKVNIKTVELFYEFLCETIKNAPNK